MSRLSRRGLLGGAAALAPVSAVAAAAAPAGAAALPDAELIRLSGDLVKLSWRIALLARAEEAMEFGTDEWTQNNDQQRDLVSDLLNLKDEIVPLEATTIPGLRAKAEALKSCLAFNPDDDKPVEDQDAFAWSLMCDVLRLHPAS